MIAAADRPPDSDNASPLDPVPGSMSETDANEDRIERALVALGAAPPQATTAAEREAGLQPSG